MIRLYRTLRLSGYQVCFLLGIPWIQTSAPSPVIMTGPVRLFFESLQENSRIICVIDYVRYLPHAFKFISY
jgi:hypothetical protein